MAPKYIKGVQCVWCSLNLETNALWFQAKTFHTVLALREGVFGTDIWVDPLENDITGVDFYVSVKLKWTSFTFFLTNPYK